MTHEDTTPIVCPRAAASAGPAALCLLGALAALLLTALAPAGCECGDWPTPDMGHPADLRLLPGAHDLRPPPCASCIQTDSQSCGGVPSLCACPLDKPCCCAEVA